jgi:hypothetical protein
MRQDFRPFAPAVLEQRLHEFVELPGDAAIAAHMTFVLLVRRLDSNSSARSALIMRRPWRQNRSLIVAPPPGVSEIPIVPP